MITDLLRSCYSADFRFFKGSPEDTRARWFFAPDGAKVLPYPHRFGSRNYDFTKDDYLGIGEQRPGGKVWRDGSNPWGYVGLEAVGDPAAWAAGLQGSPRDYPIETDLYGSCAACFEETAGAYSLDYKNAYDVLRPL